jgi:hypothetical protein
MGATTTTVVTTVLGCGVAALLVALVAVRHRANAERVRRERLEEELTRARTDVAALGRRLDDLGDDVRAARQTAERAAARSAELTSRSDREFVITSLGHPEPVTTGAEGLARRRPVSALEERLVQAASRHTGSPSGTAATRLLVATAALGHGVRRALSPDVLDRAAAEATVARRRSRRDRKRELREARRVVRTVQERPSGKHVA